MIFKYLPHVVSLSMFVSLPLSHPPHLIFLFSSSLPRRLQKAKVSITCSLPAGHMLRLFVFFFYGIRESGLWRLILTHIRQAARPPGTRWYVGDGLGISDTVVGEAWTWGQVTRLPAAETRRRRKDKGESHGFCWTSRRHWCDAAYLEKKSF